MELAGRAVWQVRETAWKDVARAWGELRLWLGQDGDDLAAVARRVKEDDAVCLMQGCS